MMRKKAGGSGVTVQLWLSPNGNQAVGCFIPAAGKPLNCSSVELPAVNMHGFMCPGVACLQCYIACIEF